MNYYTETVSYNIAKLLSSLASYNSHPTEYVYINKKKEWFLSVTTIKTGDEVVYAPTYAEVLDWLIDQGFSIEMNSDESGWKDDSGRWICSWWGGIYCLFDTSLSDHGVRPDEKKTWFECAEALIGEAITYLTMETD